MQPQHSYPRLTAVLAATVLLAAACTTGSSPSPATTPTPAGPTSTPATATASPVQSEGVQVVTFWQFSERQAEIDAWNNVIAKFESLHQNIKVKMELVPWTDQQEKITTALTSGGLPDVSELGNDVVAQYQHIGALAPLDQYFQAESARLGQDITQDFWPGDSFYYHLDGHWWASPIFEDTLALFYRTDLFKSAGLDPTKPPKTWDELKQYAKLLTKDGVYGLGLLQSIDYVTLQQFMSVYLSYGARFLNDQGKCGFDTPEFKQALDYYTSFHKENLTPPDSATYTYPDMEAQWKLGKLAMFMDSAYLWADTQSADPKLGQNIAVAPVPAGSKGMFAFLGGVPLVLWDTSKVKDAAAEFIVFATNPDQLGDLDRAANLLPGRQSLATQAPWNNYPTTVFLGQLPRAFAYLYPDPIIPQMGGLEVSAVQTAVQSVALDQATLDQAAKSLCDTVNAALSQ